MSRSLPCRLSLSSERQWQRSENANSLIEQAVRSFERQRDLGRRARCLRRIGNAPVCGHRLPRPDRAGLRCRVVTDGEYEIEFRFTSLGELIP